MVDQGGLGREYLGGMVGIGDTNGGGAARGA